MTWIVPGATAGHDERKTLPRSFDTPLPIDAVLDELSRTLAAQRRRAGGAARRRQDHAGAAGAARCAVGRGKKSSCWSRAGSPPAPPPSAWPRRWRSAGDTVGYRVRFGSKVSRATRIEVVTEGIFTRLILDDPELTGVAAVLFDEFHERSLDADLGLALARDVQAGCARICASW